MIKKKSCLYDPVCCVIWCLMYEGEMTFTASLQCTSSPSLTVSVKNKKQFTSVLIHWSVSSLMCMFFDTELCKGDTNMCNKSNKYAIKVKKDQINFNSKRYEYHNMKKPSQVIKIPWNVFSKNTEWSNKELSNSYSKRAKTNL